MPEVKDPEFTPSTMLRNNPGMIRDCFWDGDWFVIRQISADPANGQDGMKIKVFRLSVEEANILQTAIKCKSADAGRKG